ncbi:hypothetical protein XHV734_3963 [Xanthomonas hortorum pv. vitians]|nr:hypothetical protein XHV734_3963 [Xanthomonas hortorum pv. vitians]
MSIQAMRAVTHPSSRSGGQSQWAVLADAVVGGIGAPDSAHMIERVARFALHCRCEPRWLQMTVFQMECSVGGTTGGGIAVVG